jgi:hypothetical protein
MKKSLIVGLCFFMFFFPTPAIADSVTASGGASICNQTVGLATNVSAYQTANGDCVVEFKNVGTTTWTVPSGVTSVTYLIVAGGGGGGGGTASEHGGGGGGAGGLMSGTLTVPSGNVSVVVGGGGAGGSLDNRGSNGGNSSLAGAVASNGGGGGGSYFNTGVPQSGGSGGGGACSASNSQRTGAIGTGGQGNKGGDVTRAGTDGRHGAGGGGAGALGESTTASGLLTISAGAGGSGLSSTITGTSRTYAGGGGGGSGGTGGAGGGGTGGFFNGTLATAGTANTGGGGGGGTGTGGATAIAGAAGGSGIVIIRYATPPTNSIAPTISGNATYGETLTATTGTWQGSSTSYSYQWSRSATVGGTYSDIAGAINSTYVLTSTDVGNFLKVMVTATNSAGSAASLSTATAQVVRATTTISLTAAPGDFIYRTAKTLTFSSSVAGKVTLRANRETISGCKNRNLNAGNSFSITCSFRPSTNGFVVITAAFTPTDSMIDARSTVSPTYFVTRKTIRR